MAIDMTAAKIVSSRPPTRAALTTEAVDLTGANLIGG